MWPSRRSSARAPARRRSNALSPLAATIARAIERATAAGVAESAEPERDAETVFALVLDGLDDVTLGRGDSAERGEYLWKFVAGALHVVPTSSPLPEESP